MQITSCTNCKHYFEEIRNDKEISFCKAFPEKIPEKLLSEKIVYLYHYKPIGGQVGNYVFEFNTLGDDYTLKFFYLSAMRRLERAQKGDIIGKKYHNDVLQWADDNPKLVRTIEKFYDDWKNGKVNRSYFSNKKDLL